MAGWGVPPMIARPTGPGVRSHPSTVDRTRPHGVARAVNRASARGLRGPVERTGCEQGVIYAADRSARSGAGCQAAGGADVSHTHSHAQLAPARSRRPTLLIERPPRSLSASRTMHDARCTMRDARGGWRARGCPRPGPASWPRSRAWDTPRLDWIWIGLDWIGLDGTGLGVPRQPGPHGGSPTHSSAGNGHGNRETSSTRRRVHGTNSSAGRPDTPRTQRTQRTQKEDRSKDVESRIASTQPPCDAGMQVVVSAAHQGHAVAGRGPGALAHTTLQRTPYRIICS